MSSLNADEWKQFLKFVTGSSWLPFGGFKALSPLLTVVWKSEADKQPDTYLPSVMTCQNFLKIPDYSSYEIFSFKMNQAIKEGQANFTLS